MPEETNAQEAFQIFEKRLNDIQLTLHALLSVLDEDDIIDQDRINEKAQEIVEELEDQQEQENDVAEDLGDELE
ncbi:MAG: hypothetical protein ABEI78_01935 [Candidatus Nanohaloarchaea archaeon]